MRFEKTFEFSGAVADVWEAFTNNKAEHRVWDPDNPYQSGGTLRTEFVEREENVVLSWKTMHADELVSTMTVVFNEISTGTRISITSEGFAIPDFMHEGRMRGWTEMLWDLELYFRTGKMLNRLHNRKWGRLGLSASGKGYGVVVASVSDGSPASKAGVQEGDVVVRVGSAPVFEVGDVWLLESVLPEGDIEIEYFRGKELLTGTGRVA